MRFLLVLLPLLFALAGPARAADECPHGTLDKRYCDVDGDLIADAPTDPKQWLDPDPLIFTYDPVEDPSVWAGIWQHFVDYLAKATGRRVTYIQIQSYAAELEALRSGRLHAAGVNAGSVPLAVNCAGFVPAVTMVTPTGPLGYTMDFIVPAASPIKTVADLKGHTVAFVSPTSNTGFKAPTVLLKSDYGLVLDKDYTSRFTGKHDTSIIGIANGDYEAAAVTGTLMERMAERHVIDLSKIRRIYTSPPFPTDAFGVSNRLNPALAAKIRQAFLSYDWKDPDLHREFPDVTAFGAVAYAKDYAMIRKIDAAAGASYDCR